MTRLKLNTEWIIGDQIGAGGFGRVYAARSELCERAVLKLIPKEKGADRELLFVDVTGVRNIVPIIDSGETQDSWAIVMPRADQSLREYFNSIGDRLEANAALPVLMNIAVALADIDGKIVHRDLKPENILLLKGIWCLADFGISRYAEATTAQETHKYALSAPYAAPERWRSERATSATDMYSFGAIAFELVTGALPFAGPRLEDYREQHLHISPTVPTYVPAHLGALIEECLYKAPGARPGPSNTIERLIRIAKAEPIGGLAKLQQANRAEIVRKGELSAQESAARSATERRKDLATSAAKNLVAISEIVKTAILEVASTATLQNDGGRGWTLNLASASLAFGALDALLASNIGNPPLSPFTTVACTSLILSIPPDRSGYAGRSHSLWYCDAQETGRYCWFETAFMINPLLRQTPSQNPFALKPTEAANAFRPVLSEIQLAWPFIPIQVDNLNDFIDRWASWFADAAQGKLSHPSSMPERQTEGSWRRMWGFASTLNSSIESDISE